MIGIAGIEFETVDAVFLDQVSESLLKVLHGLRIGQVERGAVTVPPPADVGATALVLEEVALPVQQPKGLAVRAEVGTNPEHHLETLVVQRLHHAFGIGETPGMKLPHAVVLLPVVIDHQHAGGETVGQDVMGILANPVLTLIVDQLDPGIVLRFDKE